MRHPSLYLPGGLRPALSIPRNWMRRNANRERRPDYAALHPAAPRCRLRSALFLAPPSLPSTRSLQFNTWFKLLSWPVRDAASGGSEDRWKMSASFRTFQALDPGRRACSCATK
jgi:hypothetical protein